MHISAQETKGLRFFDTQQNEFGGMWAFNGLDSDPDEDKACQDSVRIVPIFFLSRLAALTSWWPDASSQPSSASEPSALVDPQSLLTKAYTACPYGLYLGRSLISGFRRAHVEKNNPCLALLAQALKEHTHA